MKTALKTFTVLIVWVFAPFSPEAWKRKFDGVYSFSGAGSFIKNNCTEWYYPLKSLLGINKSE